MKSVLKKPHELTMVIVGSDTTVRDLFSKRGYNVRTIASLNGAYDGVVFTGGGDINPYLYGQGLHPSTYPDYARDLRELAVLRRVPRLKPKIGICRGGQLLNVYSGGSMFQDVDNHRGGHSAFCLLTNKELTVSSAHHQAMDPTPEAMLLMTSTVSKKRTTYDNTDFLNTKDKAYDVEACYYEHTRSYCFQGHPEYSYAPDSAEYFFKHLEFCFGDLWCHTIEEEDENPREVRVG